MNAEKLLLALLFASALYRLGWSQADGTPGIVNGQFEESDESGFPTGWNFPPALRSAGYVVLLDTEHSFEGTGSALIDATQLKPGADTFGNLMQSLDAQPFRGRRVRFRAAVRTAELGPNGRAQLWFRVDRDPASGQPAIAAFDNMDDRPIRSGQWAHYEITGDVAEDAQRIMIGLLVLGQGQAWLDDATFEIVDDETPVTAADLAGTPGGEDPPQPFWNHWLWLVVMTLVLMAFSQAPVSAPALIAAQHLALRFSFAYWLLYSLPAPFSQILAAVRLNLLQPYEACVDNVVRWTALHLLGIEKPLPAPGGSGDTTFDFVRVLICFVLALAVAVVWSAVDWRKTDYRWIKDLLRSYLRYVLAITMLGYGLAKVGSTYNQFPEPGVNQLLKTYGDSSPMNLVWTFMGASRAYTIFAGLGEIAGALLLIWRRTTVLGAIVVIGVMSNVVMLNFCYDVPVKQFSSHLLLMAVFLLIPDTARLAQMFVWNCPTEAAELRPPYVTGQTIWIHRGVKAAILLITVAMPIGATIRREIISPTDSEPPTFYGGYVVEEFQRDGQQLPPDLNNQNRWRTVSFRRVPWGANGGPGPTDFLSVTMMSPDGQRPPQAGGTFTLSDDQTTVQLQSGHSSIPSALEITVVDEQHLRVASAAGDQALAAKLRRVNREDFLLVRRGFHWVNEFPFNR